MLPTDISIEVVVSILITCFGLVVGTPELRPVKWCVWAGMIEGERDNFLIDSDGFLKKNDTLNPFKYIESRPGFIDIRKQRREFFEWASNDVANKITEEKEN